MRNNIFVVGGYTVKMQLNTVEKYDVLNNQWTVISSMNSPRSALGCVAWKGIKKKRVVTNKIAILLIHRYFRLFFLLKFRNFVYHQSYTSYRICQ